MPEQIDKNNNKKQQQQHPNQKMMEPKNQRPQQNLKDNKVNAFDYNNPPNSHSLDDNQQDKPEENQGEQKSRWVEYLLFFAGLLMIGGGIALAVLVNPWCGFVCLGGFITGAVGVIRWNVKEQNQYLPLEGKNENEKDVENQDKNKAKENGKGQEQTEQINQNKDDDKLDFSSMLQNIEQDVKNEEAQNANNIQDDDNEKPNEIVENTKVKPEKKQDDIVEKTNDTKQKPVKQNQSTDNQPDMKGLADLFNPSKITGKNNTESKHNLKTNNQAKDKSNGLSTN